MVPVGGPAGRQRRRVDAPRLVSSDDVSPTRPEVLPDAVVSVAQRTRVAYGEGCGGSFSGGARPEVSASRRSRHFPGAAYTRTHPGSPTVKQHLAAIRMLCDWLVLSQGLPVNPRRPSGGRSTSSPRARRRSSRGRGEEAPRAHRYGHAGRAPRPGAPLRHALQLRAGERGPGDAAAGLLPAGEPGVAPAPREGRAAARRAGTPIGPPEVLDDYVAPGPGWPPADGVLQRPEFLAIHSGVRCPRRAATRSTQSSAS